jgi:hypothetical protein
MAMVRWMSQSMFVPLLVLFVATACRGADGERAPSIPDATAPRERAEPREQLEPIDGDTTGQKDPAAPDDELAQCVAACVEQNQMQATAPEVIETNCRRTCADGLR